MEAVEWNKALTSIDGDDNGNETIRTISSLNVLTTQTYSIYTEDNALADSKRQNCVINHVKEQIVFKTLVLYTNYNYLLQEKPV